jgi:serine phosphatase RsbU (regulator of sigma subunit)
MKHLFLKYIWEFPTNLPVKKHRDFRVNSVIGLCGFFAHIMFISLFIFFEVRPMVVFNIFSIVIFAYILIQNKLKTKKYLIIICNLEVVLHAMVATYFLGFDSSFHFYTFLMFQGIFILNTYKNINWYLGILSIVGYIFIIWMVQNFTPVYGILQNNGIQFFSYFNIICASIISILITVYFKTTADSAENVLLVSNEKLHQQNIEIDAQREEISGQKAKTENILKSLNESIDYAKHIQDSVLPIESTFSKAFGANNSFVLFKPKNIVSGDFYFLETHINKIFLAVSDCTGHGVSGAMMSLLGINALSKIINKGEINDPSIILDKLHKNIKYTLKQEETNTNDGMEIALLVIDQLTKTINFAGAGASLIFIHNNIFNELKGNKFSIGGRNFIDETERKFDVATLNYSENTMFYMTTDGYQDQLNSEYKNRFTSKQLFDLLLENNALRMVQQKIKLEENFNNWKKNTPQIDDVLLLGFKL